CRGRKARTLPHRAKRGANVHPYRFQPHGHNLLTPEIACPRKQGTRCWDLMIFSLGASGWQQKSIPLRFHRGYSFERRSIPDYFSFFNSTTTTSIGLSPALTSA